MDCARPAEDENLREVVLGVVPSRVHVAFGPGGDTFEKLRAVAGGRDAAGLLAARQIEDIDRVIVAIRNVQDLRGGRSRESPGFSRRRYGRSEPVPAALRRARFRPHIRMSQHRGRERLRPDDGEGGLSWPFMLAQRRGASQEQQRCVAARRTKHRVLRQSGPCCTEISKSENLENLVELSGAAPRVRIDGPTRSTGLVPNLS